MVERRQQGQRDRDGVAVLSRSVGVEGFVEQRPAGLGSVFGEEVGDECERSLKTDIHDH